MRNEHALAAMLVDLANLHPSVESIDRVRKKWPDFLPETPLRYMDYKPGKASTSTGEVVQTKVPDELEALMWLRYIVRDLWRGNPDAGVLKELEHILLVGKLGALSAPQTPQEADSGPLAGIIGVDWKRRTFIYRPQTLLQRALYYLLQESDKAKVCGNADCLTPYFIAHRSNARYCSSDCVEAIQRQAKRDWWASSGQAWREDHQGKKSKKSRRK